MAREIEVGDEVVVVKQRSRDIPDGTKATVVSKDIEYFRLRLEDYRTVTYYKWRVELLEEARKTVSEKMGEW